MTLTTLSLAADAAAEAVRLEDARRLIRDRPQHACSRWESDAPLIARARSADSRRCLAGRLLLIFAIRCEDTSGRTVETEIVGALVDVGPSPQRAGSHRQRISATVRDLTPLAQDRVAAALTSWSEQTMNTATAMSSARLGRERAIARRVALIQPHLFQGSLFDTRAERARAAEAAASSERERTIAARLRECAAVSPAFAPPELILVLTP